MSLCNPSKGVATSPKTLLRDVQRGPWENTKMGTLEMFTEIIKPQQSDRVEVAPGDTARIPRGTTVTA